MHTTAVRERPEAGIEWGENASLDRLNSMGLHATARLLATAATEEALTRFLRWADEADEDFLLLGAGTNVIFGDEFLDRVILRLGGDFARCSLEGSAITAGAAVPLARLVQESAHAGLTGLEGGWGIPGTLGGALAGNAGTPDWTVGEAVEWVELFERAGAKHRLRKDEIRFAYRRSSLADGVIARARLALAPDDPVRIEERSARARARRGNQPHGVRSAGCIFRNPPGDAAGRLIAAAGLKGLRRGGAAVSSQHANFIVNEGGANVKEVLELIDEVQRRVLANSDLGLETEVRIFRSLK